MYRPPHFVEQDADALLALMRAAPLATLVHRSDELAADLLPLEVDRTDSGWTLTGHVARANPLWRSADGQDVLVLFRGPQAYVSPNWYPGKAVHGKAVPTWNYTMVQAHGRLRVIEDGAWLRALVTRLTKRHEDTRDAPWQVTDAPSDYIDAMLRAIVGIEIVVTRLEGKFKLSQNRSAEDQNGVVLGLEADTVEGIQPEAHELARQMQAASARSAGSN